MSTIAADTHGHGGHDPHGPGAHGHDPHLAHHFQTLDQQFTASKLGMWTFLATEILMFGGLFVLYSVFRANHPAVYLYAHSALQTNLGAINTAVLLASSFTMAWAVRATQLQQRGLALILLALTFMGGVGFMGIKAVEYTTKIRYHLWVGEYNAFNAKYVGDAKGKVSASEHILVHKLEHGGMSAADAEKHAEDLIGPAEHAPAGTPGAAPSSEPANASEQQRADHAQHEHAAAAAPATQPLPAYMLPFEPQAAANAPDSAKHTPIVDALKPPTSVAGGTVAKDAGEHAVLTYSAMKPFDQSRVLQFFSIYYMMTGLHGLHVVVGMALIAWLWLRTYRGHFSRTYFTPVDLGGLYWHLVDLIWIFLFPLLYLIH